MRVVGGERRHLARQDVAQHAVLLLEHQRLALTRLDQRGTVLPFDGPAALARRGREHGRAGAVAEQAGADQHARVVVQVHRRAAHLDADRQHVRRRAGADQRSAQLQVRQRRGAALADEVEGLHVGAQAEPFDDVAREARAQIAGAGADDDGVDRRRIEPGRGERARPGLGGERRRMGEKAPIERVGVDREHLVERIEREPARLDAVVALQDGPGDEVGPAVEAGEPVRALEGRQALGLGVARRGRGRAEAAKVHAMQDREGDAAKYRGNRGDCACRQAVRPEGAPP